MVGREVPSSFYILIYARMARELGSNGLIAQVFDEVQEVRYSSKPQVHPGAVYVGDHKLFTNYYFLNTDKKAFLAAERAR